MFHENLSELNGLEVYDFVKAGDFRPPLKYTPRLRSGYDNKNTLVDLLPLLLNEPDVGGLQGLVLGLWSGNTDRFEATSEAAVQFLVANASKLPNLEALFVGDIIAEENEISWINNSDMSSLWAAFPKLSEFGVRGTNALRLGKINHANLKKLVVQSGGLSSAVTAEALETNAPIEHFELWLGIEEYGLTTRIEQFNELFAGQLFPNLKTLALRNSDFANELAKRLATSEVITRIERLDLSMGTFKDDGADALIAGGRIGHLKSLDVTHNYLSKEARDRLAAATPKLIAHERQKADEWSGDKFYYVSVSE